MANRTSLDRDSWSFHLCMICRARKAQLVMDHKHRNRSHGEYRSLCWQCYWNDDNWLYGPIVNCGPMWDELDVRRGVQVGKDSSSPS